MRRVAIRAVCTESGSPRRIALSRRASSARCSCSSRCRTRPAGRPRLGRRGRDEPGTPTTRSTLRWTSLSPTPRLGEHPGGRLQQRPVAGDELELPLPPLDRSGRGVGHRAPHPVVGQLGQGRPVGSDQAVGGAPGVDERPPGPARRRGSRRGPPRAAASARRAGRGRAAGGPRRAPPPAGTLRCQPSSAPPSRRRSVTPAPSATGRRCRSRRRPGRRSRACSTETTPGRPVRSGTSASAAGDHVSSTSWWSGTPEIYHTARNE